MKLYEITEDQMWLMQYLEDNGGEATEEVMQALAITQSAFESKASAYAHIILQLDGEADLIDKEIKRLQAMKKAKTNSVERLKQSLLQALMVFGREDKGIRRFETPLVKLSTRKSNSIEILDENAIPLHCKVIKEEVSKTLIKEILETGQTVDGACMKTNYSVVIR